MVNITGTGIHTNRMLQEFIGMATVPRFCNIGFQKVNSKKIDAKHKDTRNDTLLVHSSNKLFLFSLFLYSVEKKK